MRAIWLIFWGLMGMLAFSVCGFYLGKGPELPILPDENYAAKEVSHGENLGAIPVNEAKDTAAMPLQKGEHSSNRLPASSEASRSRFVASHPQAALLFERTSKLFARFSEREALANWVSFGIIFSNSPEFGQELEAMVRKLNERPSDTLNALREGVANEQADSFMKMMFLNLADRLEVSPDERIAFLGEAAVSSLQRLSAAEITEEVLPGIQALDFLKKSNPSKEQVQKALQSALEKVKDPTSRKEIVNIFNSRFPGIDKD